MARFLVEVLRLTNVEPHPNADRLDLAVVGNYRVIVAKGSFHTDDLVAYIPEAALLPEALIDELGVRNYLAGSQHNRVKAQKLRGTLSQGLVYAARPGWESGQDVSVELGITKWEPEIPVGMSGNPIAAPVWWKSYDVETYNRYPELLLQGEAMYVTEKIHGTCGLFGTYQGEHYVSSKGMSDRHLALAYNDANLYWLAARQYQVHTAVEAVFGTDLCVEIFAEVYGTCTPNGKKVQDLAYNAALGLRLAVFDIAVNREFLPYPEAIAATERLGLAFVPVLYQGPFDQALVLALAEGLETVSGTSAHMREGIVIRPEVPRESEEIGRVILKHVSAAYLTRTGDDVTEYT